MNKVAFTFICKNESHVIKKMLASVRPFTDIVVGVDTGSTDNTIQLIHSFGKQYGIPTHVYERPFDDYCNSRNFGLEKLHELLNDLGWDKRRTWAFYIDCDEVLKVDYTFEKATLCSDLYYVIIQGGEFKYTKHFMFRVSTNLCFEGPIHECLKEEGLSLSREMISGITVINRPIGASWKGNVEKKYIWSAETLVSYINAGNRKFRWVFYTGECYGAAADAAEDTARKQQWLDLANDYYRQALALPCSRDEKYRLYKSIAENLSTRKENWPHVEEALLNAMATDRRHAEPLYLIMSHYVRSAQWEIAYMYSSFAVYCYHGNIPGDNDISEVWSSTYYWKILFYHTIICHRSQRHIECKSGIQVLQRQLRAFPNAFSPGERIMLTIFISYMAVTIGFVRWFSKSYQKEQPYGFVIK